MSFKALYEYVQTLQVPIGRNAVIAKIEELTGQKIRYIRSGLNTDVLLGYFLVSGNPQHDFVRRIGGGSSIVIARGLDRPWERLVLFKEMMHFFDEPIHRTNSQTDLEQLLTDFCGAAEVAGDISPQLWSELACFWMAIGALCPETTRAELQQLRDNGKISAVEIATKLRIPEKYVPAFFNPRIKEIMATLTDC